MLAMRNCTASAALMTTTAEPASTMTTDLRGASLPVLNTAEEFRQVLNLLRITDIGDDARDRLVTRSKLLAARLQELGVDPHGLLHDRAWASRPVPGATFTALGSEYQPRRRSSRTRTPR